MKDYLKKSREGGMSNMNVFKNESDIFGQYSSNKVYESMKKFLKITKKIREL